MLSTKRGILLPIALRNSNRAIHPSHPDPIIRDIPDPSQPSAAIKQRLETRLDAWPDFDAGAVAGIGERNVGDVQVFDDVSLVGVLAERAD